MKKIDDFVSQSELQPGEEAQSVRTVLEEKRAVELTKKYFNLKNPSQVLRNS